MHKAPEMVDHPNPILRRAVANERVALAAGLDEAGLFPFFATAASPSAPRTVFAGCEVVNLGSNNYLGLANDPRVIDAAVEATRRFGSGLTGSRLMNGNSEIHDELEEMLCRFTGMEAALVFSTGYGANLGAITGLTTPADTVVTDTEVHASLYDGIAMAGVKLRRFRHNNTRHAQRILTQVIEKGGGGGAMLVVDGIYSTTRPGGSPRSMRNSPRWTTPMSQNGSKRPASVPLRPLRTCHSPTLRNRQQESHRSGIQPEWPDRS